MVGQDFAVIPNHQIESWFFVNDQFSDTNNCVYGMLYMYGIRFFNDI